MNMLQLLTARKEINSVTKKSPTKLLSPGGWPYEYFLIFALFLLNGPFTFDSNWSIPTGKKIVELDDLLNSAPLGNTAVATSLVEWGMIHFIGIKQTCPLS